MGGPGARAVGACPGLGICGGDGAAATRTCQVSSQDQQRSNFRSPCRSGGPGPSPGSRGADPGKGAGDPGSFSLFPCSPPGAWPGPDSASARPCAPPHTRAHTHSHSLARSHTRTPLPPSSVYLLQLSGDPGEVPHCACATQSPRRPRAALSAATLRRWRRAVS